MGSYVNKKVEYLVVDTSAFINKASIQDIAENILTVPQVVEEIKSKRQLKRLIVLPYDLTVKEAFSENIKFVSEFSKKTGDYTSLSVTDINVIALTYQLEKEKNGDSHLNSAPVCRPTIQQSAAIPDDLKKIAGFHNPKKESLSRPETVKSKASDYDSPDDELYESADDGECEFSSNSDDTSEKICQKEWLLENSSEVELKPELIKGNHEDRNLKDTKEEIELEDDNSDSDSDWITPSNIEKAKTQISNVLNEDFENVNVACLTTDFAMQNVLKQIGLHVISIDGKLIKQLRTFILRCYGCFKTTSIMTKVFCPNCGNKTLKKVAVSLDENGTQRLHINFRKPLTARGKRYSLPHFKGGKHSNNPIICEDQPMPQQRPSRLSRTKNNPLDDDYLAGYSPFVTRDVTSKSAMLGIKPHLEMKHLMRKNQNESRKKRK